MNQVSISVAGTPAPQGSKKAFVNAYGRAQIVDDNKRTLRDWRNDVAVAAREACQTPFLGPVMCHIEFRLKRPLSAPKRVQRPAKKPDLDKLVRACFDALTSVVWRDDAQVVHLEARKRFAFPEEQTGVDITVSELPEARTAPRAKLFQQEFSLSTGGEMGAQA